MPSFKVPPLVGRRTLVAVAAASVVGSALLVAGPSASAEVVTCNSATRNWAALYPTVSDWNDGVGATTCIGYVSTNNLSYNDTQVFCAGNNQGYVSYDDLNNGGGATHTFWPDGSYVVAADVYRQEPVDTDGITDDIDVTTVKITGWSGTAGC